ncbi:hypothetical protein C900_02344 [Fulvivirga imtechensis AK7]|uniref:Uncharacterized protein n=1 Tax=Fulvivirga imtechensis AK7 TaxID=1237149 RepID=L8JVZ0_9BACT|nr:hypothetical protein [Fulvivirga imtechensis]ELR71759.1 hypothetical protein C900_02344 [Fulvivirga imtechensis AK7]
MSTCEVKLYNGRSLFYACNPTEGIKSGEFSELQKAVGEHLETPQFMPVDVANDTGVIRGTVKDLDNEETPYKIRVWLLAEYEPEKL